MLAREMSHTDQGHNMRGTNCPLHRGRPGGCNVNGSQKSRDASWKRTITQWATCDYALWRRAKPSICDFKEKMKKFQGIKALTEVKT